MKRVSFDVETHVIRPGVLFPKLVCVTTSDGTKKDIFLASLGAPEIIRLLQDPEVILVGHNVSFDLGVIIAEAIVQGIPGIADPAHWILSLVFQAYADNRIVDTMVRAMLVSIAQGKFQEIDGQRRGKQFSLEILALNWLHRKIQKQDTWRLHYAYLDGKPLAEWPQDAIDYAILDSEITWDLDASISAWAISEGQLDGTIPNEFEQHRAAFVLHLMSGWGVRVDEIMVKLVRENLEAQRKTSYEIMDQYGIFKKDRYGGYKLTKKGARRKDLKRLRELIAQGYAEQGEEAPLTAGGKSGKKQIATDVDSAKESGHPAALEYANGMGAEKLLNTYIPALERGKEGRPITSNPNVLVASGRTSWTNPNLQNPPRLNGIRECIVPREREYEEIAVSDDYILLDGESFI